MARSYKFELPYVLSAWKVGFAISKMQSMGVWDSLPAALRTKANDCHAAGRDFAITMADCDSLTDPVWTQIAHELSLAWSPTSSSVSHVDDAPPPKEPLVPDTDGR